MDYESKRLLCGQVHIVLELETGFILPDASGRYFHDKTSAKALTNSAAGEKGNDQPFTLLLVSQTTHEVVISVIQTVGFQPVGEVRATGFGTSYEVHVYMNNAADDNPQPVTCEGLELFQVLRHSVDGLQMAVA